MTPPQRMHQSSPAPPSGHAVKAKAVQGVSGVRARYRKSWVGEMAGQLNALGFLDWTVIFGAELLWSALPFVILLSSLANERLDDDLSRHIGLDREGAHIVTGLFRSSPSHAVVPILTGLLFSFAGVIAIVASLQVIYERLYEQEHRGWRDFPRYVVWVVVLFAVLVADGAAQGPERTAVGPVVQALLTFVATALFFAWTIHFLLDGRVAWRLVIRPAVTTALLWVGFGFFSSLYFSSVLIDDNKTYGTIGVAFTFLSWFVVIGGVVMLGAAGGAVWQRRSERRAGRV